MAETKKPSLTVLGGALAGLRFILPDEGVVTIGSAEDSSFRLELPTVSSVHAMLMVEGGGRVTVHDAGAERPLHVNDAAVDANGSPLRNGDILWLGAPGEEDVVMLQCVLPRRAAGALATPAPPAEAAAEPASEVETVALWGSPSTPAEAAVPGGDEPTVGIEPDFLFSSEPSERSAPAAPVQEPFPMPEEEPLVSVEPGGEEAVPSGPEAAAPVGEPLFVDAQSESAPEWDRETVFIDADAASAEGDAIVVEATEAVVTDQSEAETVLITDADEVAAAVSVEPEVAPTVVIGSEPTTGLVPEGGPPVPPPPPAAQAPTAPSASTPPSPPVPAARRSPPARQPRPPPRPHAERPRAAAAPAPARREATASRTPLLVAGGLAALLALAGGGWAVWRLALAKPAAKPTPVARATPRATPFGATPPPAALPPVSATPEAVPATPEPTPLLPTPAASTLRPSPTATPRVGPTLTPPPVAAPKPVAAAPTPSAPAAPTNAARVADLLAQAEAALATRDFDGAIGRLDEALRLEPGHAGATAARARAQRGRESARKRFVAGATAVQTQKAQKEGLTGFDTGDVALQKAPDFLGRIEFEMTPDSGIQPADAWRLRYFVVNDGKKPIRVQGVTVATTVNGAGSGGPAAPREREIAPQQRVLLGEASGSWAEGTSSWSSEVTVTASKGDSLRATITWR